MPISPGGVPRKSDEDIRNWSFVNCYETLIFEERTSVAAFVADALLASICLGKYRK